MLVTKIALDHRTTDLPARVVKLLAIINIIREPECVSDVNCNTLDLLLTKVPENYRTTICMPLKYLERAFI